MPRYIDADAVMVALEREIESADDWKTAHEIANVVKYFPTSDVVEVVRCRDCKYRKFVDWGMGDCLYPKGSKHIAYDYHYCSYAKRRDDGQIHRSGYVN